MVDDPIARAMVGFLLVRGGVHIVAYAKALEKLTGVDVGKLLPIPDISNKRFPEARKHEDRAAPDPLPVQPGRLQARSADLERPAPRGRLRAARRGRVAEGFPPPDLEEEPRSRADRAGYRPGHVREHRQPPVWG